MPIHTACRAPGCNLPATQRGRCDTHRRDAHQRDNDRYRKRKRKQFYNSRDWKRTAARIRRERPICEYCGEAPSEEVHHVIPLEDGGPLYPDETTGLKALCRPCHFKEDRRLREKRGESRGQVMDLLNLGEGVGGSRIL